MTRYISEDYPEKRAAANEWGTRQLFRRPAPVDEGLAIFEIKVFEDDEVVSAGDGKFKFDIPSDLDLSTLVDFEAWVTAPSSSGTIQVQLFNNTLAVDMLSTVASIDVGELNDKDSGTPFVIDLANDDVSYGDELWINVDNAGTDAMGLGVAVKFAPSANAAIALRGARGPAGGATDFQGAWTDTTVYEAGDIVTNNNNVYVSVVDHTSNQANDEPGVGTNWEDFWLPLLTMPMSAGWSMNVLSSSGAVSDGVKCAAVMPFDATITEAVILADQATDAEVDIWVSDFGGYPATVANTITGGTPPTLTGSIKNIDTTLAGWTTALTDGDILLFNVSGVSTARRLTLALRMEK